MKARWLIVVVALASAVAFVVSVQGGRWWVIDRTEIGPFGTNRCFEDGCRSADLAWIGAGQRWVRFAAATWAAGLVASLIAVVVAARLAARRIPHMAAKSGLVSLATAVLAGGVFLGGFPREQFATADLGRGAALFGLGIILGVIVMIAVLRSGRTGVPARVDSMH